MSRIGNVGSVPKRDKGGKKRTHADVVKAVVEYLNLRGIFAWKNNTGVAMLPGKGGKPRPVRFGKVGSADILGVLPGGRFMACEVKIGRDKLRPEQVEFLDSVKRAGGVTMVVSCVDDVEGQLP